MSAAASDPAERRGRLAIFHPPGRFELAHNPFGKDVANLQLWQALARHGGFEQIDVLSVLPVTGAEAAAGLTAGYPGGARITANSILNQVPAAQAGALIRGQPELHDLAWLRRRAASDRAFSLLGLIHTIAPPLMRHYIAMTQTAPMHPWDALICTSPAVRQCVEAIYDRWGEHLAERTDGQPPARPSLPIIPLGVDADAFAALADRPQARAKARARLGLDED